jgi:7-carboxy-7-deazaguanine synthase
MQYPVNELFTTIQGEARYTGTPSTFIRLQGCPVGCPWCDTKQTWTVEPTHMVDAATMIRKVEPTKSYAYMTAAELVASVKDREPRHVVLTGGEPCLYDLTELTDALNAEGYMVQIETSGCFPVRCHPSTWVTCSPKIDMPGGLKVLEESLARADEVKYPVGKWADVEVMRTLQSRYKLKPEDVWVQPLSQSPKATAICIEAATTMGWRVSLQTHKYAGVR